MNTIFDTTDIGTGDVQYINLVDDETVEVVLLSESNTGDHTVAYRYNGYSQNGDWRLGRLSDAIEFADYARKLLADE